VDDEAWPKSRYITNDHEAEHMAADAMRMLGFSDAKVTPVGPDSGIDVRATGAIAQVKFRSAQTGRGDIQRLVGARGNQPTLELLFFAAAGYSAHAIEYATELDVALFVFDPFGRLTSHSPAAEYLLARSQNAATEDAVIQQPVPVLEVPEVVEQGSWWKRYWLEIVVAALWTSLVFVGIPDAISGEGEYTWADALGMCLVTVGFTAFWVYRRFKR